ncbi:glycerol-3-phosphate acyltransferase RAM2-like [Andrographis paniculata]|uniref:glycerol-3-phosphate acyltransferase RAM2-like n=1 Tax=Andrographis paniculata TaxID=175694 RepID=UPI0021E89CEF|nr:glycerol-3-phosphate acyltransferase RAM2-like [Andrographis paniculata]
MTSIYRITFLFSGVLLFSAVTNVAHGQSIIKFWDKMQTIYQCGSKNRADEEVVVDMDGALLIDSDPFPYFGLVAFDVGGILRLALLLMVYPAAWFLRRFVSECTSIRVLVFATFVGVKVSDIASAAKAVLPKYYSEDLHPETWRVFSSCGKKCVVTMNPRIMVEPFLKGYLGVDMVLGVEISSWMGFATGFVDTRRRYGSSLVESLLAADIAIGCPGRDLPSMKMCKERYIVPYESKQAIRPVKHEDLPKAVIFHDGRLARKPTPLAALLILLWFPIGLLLSVVRVLVGSFGSVLSFYYTIQLLGCRIKVKGTPLSKIQNSQRSGTLYVCSHKTVIDPLFIATVFKTPRTAAVSYSVSRITEFLAPMRNIRLTRDRAKDGKLVKDALREGWNLVLCPEGTTCREPYLLRFSPLFAELSDHIVPVGLSINTGMFYGSSVRGYKWLDPFFFFMNPLPEYEVTVLDELPAHQTCRAGKSSIHVANHVQELIGAALKFKCTNLTRKDKYRMLAGTDGVVGQKPAGVSLTG